MQEPPPIEITDEHLAAVRRLLAVARVATLSTLDAAGGPYASLVTVAPDGDLAPLMLLSDLADHTRNLARDPRASLLLDDARHLKNPQTGPRVALIGRVEICPDPEEDRPRFLDRHPTAQVYAGFADFRLYRFRIDRAHFVGGFGTAVWIDAAGLRDSPAPSS